jgi:MFS family permease
MFEPLLQSFVAKFAKVHQKGAALGVANTFAYVGIFLGGAIGGWMYEHYEREGVALFVAGLSVLWVFWIIGMRNPGLRANLFLELDAYEPEKLHLLKTLDGVTDFYMNETEKLLVVKYDEEEVSEAHIKTFLKEEGVER